MDSRLLEIRLQRAELSHRIAAQRGQLADHVTHLQGGFQLADKGREAVGYLWRHPLLTGGVVAVLFARRGSARRLLAWGLRLWRGYAVLRTWRGMLR